MPIMLTLFFLLVLQAPLGSAAVVCDQVRCRSPHDTIPRFDLPATLVSRQHGAWSDPATWDGQRLPVATDKVAIQHTVIYDAAAGQAGVIGIGAGGALTIDVSRPTKLTVETILMLGGQFVRLETPGAHVFELLIRDTALDTTVDPEQYGHGLVVLDGSVTLSGAARTPTFVRLAIEPRVGDTTLTLGEATSGWRVGDRLVVPDTRQLKWNETKTNYQSQTEELTLQGISTSGLVLTLASPLRFNHFGGRDSAGHVEFLPHVANLTRNVIMRSVNPNGTRGHTFFTQRAAVDIRYVLFRDFGRTTTLPLNNTTTSGGQVTRVGTNQSGRYPWHAHHLFGPIPAPDNGYQFTFIGNAVDGGSVTHNFKWGIAVHDSHYGLIQENVVYNVSGAGVMFEDGSESYNLLERNFVVRSTSPSPDRGDARMTLKDFAHEATGFWFRGPNNYVRENVAANILDKGPDSAYGFKYFQLYLGTIRLPDFPGADTSVAGQYTTVNGHSLPLLEFARNEVYGATESGMTTWWLGTEYKTPKAQADSVIQDLHVWNVFNKGYHNYLNHRLIIDGLITRGNNPKDSACCSIGFEGGDYYLNNFTLRHADIQGFKTGVKPSSTQGPGLQRIEDSSIQAATGIQMATLRTSAYTADHIPRRSVDVHNVTFAPLPGMPFWAIKMLFNAVPVSNLIQWDTITVTDYNGTSGADFHVYYKEQAATFVVPQSVWNADGTTKVAGSPEAGLTNAQTWATYGLAIAGGVSPCTDTSTHPEIDGSVCP